MTNDVVITNDPFHFFMASESIWFNYCRFFQIIYKMWYYENSVVHFFKDSEAIGLK